MPMEHPEENERELLPEIVVDETAEDYVVMEEAGEEEEEEAAAPPPPRAEPKEESVVLEAELPPTPEQDNIFQTGKPAKKKRNVSEKQWAHLEWIRSKALERKKEKAAERKVARTTRQTPAVQSAPTEQPAPVAAVAAPEHTPPKVEPVPSPYLTHADMEGILNQYEERRAKKKEAKRKEQRARELVSTHIQQDDVWAQCFN